jgi:hypothetical protein
MVNLQEIINGGLEQSWHHPVHADIDHIYAGLIANLQGINLCTLFSC